MYKLSVDTDKSAIVVECADREEARATLARLRAAADRATRNDGVHRSITCHKNGEPICL